MQAADIGLPSLMPCGKRARSELLATNPGHNRPKDQVTRISGKGILTIDLNNFMTSMTNDTLHERMSSALTLSWAVFCAKVGNGYIIINKEASMQLQYAYCVASATMVPNDLIH